MARGRGATPIRPGFVIKDVLSGKLPLLNPSGGTTGELVSEACATDLHITYQTLIRTENHLRPRTKWLRGMTTESFGKLMRFARLMGLIELVKEEPMVYPPVSGNFYRVEMEIIKSGAKAGQKRPTAVISTRKMMRLTEKGKLEGRAWGDLRRAWQEDWELGIPVEESIIPLEPEPIQIVPEEPTREKPAVEKKPPVAKPVKKPAEKPSTETKWSPIKLSEYPTMTQLKKLIPHLKKLARISFQDGEVAQEVQKITYVLGDWDVNLEDDIALSKDAAEKAKHTKWLNVVRRTYNSLADEKFQPAISALEELL